MFGSEILEIAIGLALVYLILSLVVTAATEAFSRLLALRANNLYKGIQNLMGEVGVSGQADAFFNSPMIKSLTQPGTIRTLALKKVERRPGYISAKRFYDGLIQSLGLEGKTLGEIETALENSPVTEDLKKNLQTFIGEAGDDIEKFKASVAGWYDDSMDRVSGWFKRKAHTCTLIVAMVVTVAFNANTIKVAEVLWNDDASRTAVANLAAEVIDQGDLDPAKSAEPPKDETEEQRLARETSEAIAKGKRATEIIDQTSALPLGWKSENPLHRKKANAITKQPIPGWSAEMWLSQILGWIITVFALSLGAPFWFDTLKKLVNLRTSGTKPESSAKNNPRPVTVTPPPINGVGA